MPHWIIVSVNIMLKDPFLVDQLHPISPVLGSLIGPIANPHKLRLFPELMELRLLEWVASLKVGCSKISNSSEIRARLTLFEGWIVSDLFNPDIPSLRGFSRFQTIANLFLDYGLLLFLEPIKLQVWILG